ncbi:MAG TPA: hypothetical protein VFB06_03780 [Streptosporangiaceae bacterium]|nr:hypothetical protein [Streptosporangiaceae bacterium]
MVAVAAVLTGAGTGGWLLASHLGNHGASLRLAPAAAEHTTAAVTTAPASSPDGVSPSAALSTTPPQPVPQTVGTVTLSQDVTQDSDAQPVAAFLNQYFGAINSHDYQSYRALLSPPLQEGLTQAQFASGYRTTADSAETLTGISTAGDGDLAADVTFTSHQDPADSVDQTQSCTDWAITLFLSPDGNGSYLIDQQPSSYHASYQAC